MSSARKRHFRRKAGTPPPVPVVTDESVNTDNGELPKIGPGEEWDEDLGMVVLVNDDPKDGLENQVIEVVLKEQPRQRVTPKAERSGKGSLLRSIPLLEKIKL